MNLGSEKTAGLGTAAAPDEISLAFTNLEITRERLEEGKSMLMIDRTETQRALNILQTAFGDQDEANNDGSIQSSTKPEPLARDKPQPGAEVSPAANGASRVILVRGDTIRPEPIRWLWGGWLARGKLHIVAGAPGCGKTTIGLALAATVTAGGRWPDGTPCSPGHVLIWSGEDDPGDTLLPRLLAAGGDPRRVHFVGNVIELEGRARLTPRLMCPHCWLRPAISRISAI